MEAPRGGNQGLNGKKHLEEGIGTLKTRVLQEENQDLEAKCG